MRLPQLPPVGLCNLFHIVSNGNGILARLVLESCISSMSFDEFHLLGICLHHGVMIGCPTIHISLVGVSSPLEEEFTHLHFAIHLSPEERRTLVLS